MGCNKLDSIFAQQAKGGGAGAWITGVNAFLCTAVALLAIFRGEKISPKAIGFVYLALWLALLAGW